MSESLPDRSKRAVAERIRAFDINDADTAAKYALMYEYAVELADLILDDDAPHQPVGGYKVRESRRAARRPNEIDGGPVAPSNLLAFRGSKGDNEDNVNGAAPRQRPAPGPQEIETP